MKVVKRSGKKEKVKFDKVLLRLEKLSYGLDTKYVDHAEVAKKTIEGIYDEVATTELDNLSSEIAASLTIKHPDYSLFASRIAVSNIHKNVEKSFSKNIDLLYNNIDEKTGEKAPLITKEIHSIVMKNSDELDAAVLHDRDFTYDFFGIKTLERAYLLKRNGEISETPQQMLLRVALGIHKKDINSAIETYELMSEKFFTHATPTLFNAGTVRPQLSSCFLLAMKKDSIEGIYDTLKSCAKISQYAGGIGVSISNIRSRGSYIKGTGGSSTGIVPMLKNFNETASYVDQGGGKRKGSFAMYLEPWHSDVFDFLDLKKNTGKDEMRARDLFYALWVPDLFMKRVEADEIWSLMDPAVSKKLFDVYGKDFEKLYEEYEKKGMFVKQVKARELWNKIVESQIETGMPYMLYKDSCNEKSNQKNLGTIRSSNLCAEIIEYSSSKEIAVCNLASISLPKFIDDEGVYNFEKLEKVVSVIAKNIDKIIDESFYPIEEGKYSNLRNRPMGIGVQGLADTFAKLKIPFSSDRARTLNKEIFETIYYAALKTSMELSKKKGSYKTFKNSPASKGILQFDMWNVDPTNKRYDWQSLKKEIKKNGLRNSLLIALMPTASTSQILGNNESFEPFTSNLYTRRVLGGEFMVVNKHLLRDLIKLDLWDENMKNRLMAENGSIQNIEEIPKYIKEIYKTVWEIPQKDILEMAKDRGAFVDQSQSMNIFMEGASLAKITSMHFYGWKAGLKTGMYYMRTKSARDAIKFTVEKDTKKIEKNSSARVKQALAAAEDEEICESCSA